MINNPGPSLDPWGILVTDSNLTLCWSQPSGYCSSVFDPSYCSLTWFNQSFICLSEMMWETVSSLAWSLHLHSSKWWRLSGCLSTIFLFTNLWWLWQIIFLPFICLQILSREIWFITLSGIEVKLTGLQFAGSSFLKRGTTSFLTPLKKFLQLPRVFRVLRVATQWYWSVPSALMDISQDPHSFV